jgi:predicted ArsR family transcriptional regulator
MRDGYLRGALSPRATQRQMDVLAAFVAAGGSVQDAADLVGIRPSTVKRHLADLRARSGLTTEQLHQLAVPAEEGRRGDEEGDPAVTRDRTTRRREQDPVDGPELRSARRPMQHA